MSDQLPPSMSETVGSIVQVGELLAGAQAMARSALASPGGPSPRLLQVLGLFREALGLMGLAGYAVEPGGPGARSRLLALRHKSCGHPVLTPSGATWREGSGLVELVTQALEHETECRG